MGDSLRTPSLRRHKPSGLAVVTLNNVDHYLGSWPADHRKAPAAARQAYDRLIAEWLANGRRLVVPEEGPPAVAVNELILAYWRWAEQHYRREDGTTTNELSEYRQSLRPLRELYGPTPAADFGPLKLKAVRQRMIDAGWRRGVVHFNVTAHPTAAWVRQQIRDAFPFDEAPRYLIRDNDGVYGDGLRQHLENLGIEEVRIAPRSPWQNPFVERLIGSIRRECLDHVIVFSERHLYRVLKSYFDYYHNSRTHRALDNNAPCPRTIEPPEQGEVIAVPKVGGLHHCYTRVA